MAPRKTGPIAQAAYDQLAEGYAARVDTKPHNAYYERPATLSLLPDVFGKNVLDVGCGPGVYAQWLFEHGARVIALDANPKMIRFARRRLGDKVRLIQASLDDPLDFLVDALFDLVLAPLVLDYVKDWLPVFKEFHRVLKPGGWLVFSLEHPYVKYYDHQEVCNYFDVELVEYTWKGFGKPVNVPSYRRPLSEVINPLMGAGFTLDRILEPQPTAEFREKAPDGYEELMRTPGFMCVRARRDTQT